MKIMHSPAHPGEILREWVGEINQQDVANALGITRTTISRILNEHAGITADVDVRLSEALGTSPGFWLALQGQYDLAEAIKAKRKKIKPLVQMKPLVTPDCWQPTAQNEVPQCGALFVQARSVKALSLE